MSTLYYSLNLLFFTIRQRGLYCVSRGVCYLWLHRYTCSLYPNSIYACLACHISCQMTHRWEYQHCPVCVHTVHSHTTHTTYETLFSRTIHVFHCYSNQFLFLRIQLICRQVNIITQITIDAGQVLIILLPCTYAL